MLPAVLCLLAVVQVLSEAPPAPPQNIHVDNWLLTWTPATEEEDITYTVQYRSFDSRVWADVLACVHISLNSCDVSSTKAFGEHGCVMLRVRAEKGRRLTSTPVKACSRHGDSCTPDFSLTTGPGSLTVHLSTNNSLTLEHGDHAKHRVYHGKEGEPLQSYKDAVASVTLRELQEGRRYCTKVQFIYFDKPVGLASCTQCELIPESKKDFKVIETVVAVVLVVVLLLGVSMAYIFIFQRGKIKRWLRPPCKIPDDFLLKPFPEHHLSTPTSSPTQEHYDVISCISPKESME
ncbi:interferon gamma receptor 2 [Plectropomus leopardus]|uniref:interferon gamma receptor 2 n=1 Tax=Plectropomus leopardus TaxID=160734 RepID=UPI001C4C1D41|nr:interferon gamma receptor 2 [Plectropomus leopardus]